MDLYEARLSSVKSHTFKYWSGFIFVLVNSLHGPENHFAERLFRTMSPTNPEFVNLLLVRSEVGFQIV